MNDLVPERAPPEAVDFPECTPLEECSSRIVRKDVTRDLRYPKPNDETSANKDQESLVNAYTKTPRRRGT